MGVYCWEKLFSLWFAVGTCFLVGDGVTVGLLGVDTVKSLVGFFLVCAIGGADWVWGFGGTGGDVWAEAVGHIINNASCIVNNNNCVLKWKMNLKINYAFKAHYASCEMCLKHMFLNEKNSLIEMKNSLKNAFCVYKMQNALNKCKMRLQNAKCIK